ncbi:MAG: exodeoxyribonuclease VII small subunit [Pirellulaceae bacterium]|nr:exodeoxyribonuclease VII small subunit [Pirellulaceae bacterium]
MPAKEPSPQPAPDERQSSAASEPPTFEAALQRLEAIVQQLEDGDLGLEQALARYEEGVGHLKRCYDLLGRAERKIELLASVDEEGNCRTQPFDEGQMSLEDKQEARSRRRSQTGASKKTSRSGGDAGGVDDSGSLF